MAYYPKASIRIKGNDTGSYTGGPFKGVLHTTEGPTSSGAIGAFRDNNSWPHFLVDRDGYVWQFMNTNKAARTLRNLSGGVETNRDSAIQIEIVGFADKPKDHPKAQWDALRELMRWIEVTHGVKPKGPGRPFATKSGQKNLRLSVKEWEDFDAWCGHCHCPENLHWDPGAIDLASLLPSVPAPVPPTPPPIEETPVAQTLIHPQGNGYLVLQNRDGGVFAYEGASFHGSLPGIGVTARTVGGAWTPDGGGYWLLGEDGAVFSFGSASYKGGFNTLDAATKGNRKPIGMVAKGNGYVIVAFDPDDNSPFDGYQFGV